ncbi:MAG: hypothetical protein WBA61_01690 [Aequorivita sp.]
MQQNHIPLKRQRDIGEMISTYFEFLKQNFKPFLNIFIRYNGIFILGFLGVSYLLVTGFVGSLGMTEIGPETNNPMYYNMLIGFGMISFFALFIITAIFNYSLAAAYVIRYEQNNGAEVENAQVWEIVKENLRKIILFILLMMVLYIGVIIVGTVFSFIPVIGVLVYYLIVMGYTSWMGLSFMAMINENRDVTDAYSEGWKLLKTYFWKCIFSNLVIGILLGILMAVVLMIPGILMGIYVFHSVSNEVDLINSPLANIIWILALSLLLILYTMYQALSQFVNGILYFSLHEETYNEATRKRIDEIGASE